MDNENNSIYKDVLTSGTGAKVTKYALSILSGAPFIGNIVGAGNSTWNEYQQEKFKKLLASWLKLQEDEIKEIGKTLMEVMERINTEDAEIQKRIESPEYLSLIKKCFRDWSAAESEEKRILIRNLLSNAAGGEKICGDDVIRLFVEWIDRYSEGHFNIIKTIYKNNGFTRQEIWDSIHGNDVREDSAEADLFRLLIHDLSLGRIIRQHRETDYNGNFIKSSRKKKSSQSQYMTSAFDDKKQYELTELGRWFVHYTMNELVPKIAEKSSVN